MIHSRPIALSIPLSAMLSPAFALPASAATRAVGPGKNYATLCSAFAAAVAGDIIEIDGRGT
jgi:hypothetical protein